jgi:hypothetical protein
LLCRRFPEAKREREREKKKTKKKKKKNRGCLAVPRIKIVRRKEAE